jgi:hypothetical protein
MTSTGWSQDAVWSLRGTKGVWPRARAAVGVGVVVVVDEGGVESEGGDVIRRVEVDAREVEGGAVRVREGAEVEVERVEVRVEEEEEDDEEVFGRIGLEDENVVLVLAGVPGPGPGPEKR